MAFLTGIIGGSLNPCHQKNNPMIGTNKGAEILLFLKKVIILYLLNINFL
jgi:hypothetical protein